MACVRRLGGRRVLTHSVMFSAMLSRMSVVRVSCRTLCADAAQAEVLEFLRAASRPKVGKAKAKQSAGQKALDLTKQANRLGDMDMNGLLLTNGKQLKEMGVPVQERKRMLNFIDKYLQGYRHDGRPGKHAWKGWREPSIDR